MKIREILSLLDAEILCCAAESDAEVRNAFSSDMLSDVLKSVKDQTVLLTGLVNLQVVRTAMMLDMRCIIFVCGKQPTPEMVALASENSIVLMRTPFQMFDASGKLYQTGFFEES